MTTKLILIGKRQLSKDHFSMKGKMFWSKTW